VAQLDVWSWLYGPPTKNVAHPCSRPMRDQIDENTNAYVNMVSEKLSSWNHWCYGARGKKQVWRPHVWTWGLLEANVLYWRMYLWYCWDFSTPPQWFGAPVVTLRSGRVPLLPPFVTSLPTLLPTALWIVGISLVVSV